MKTSYTERLSERYLAVLDLVAFIAEDEPEARVFWISRVNVPIPYRGVGIGSRLLRRVCEDADKEGVELVLGVGASDGLNEKQLIAWYERHGFVDGEKRGGTMRRLPTHEYQLAEA